MSQTMVYPGQELELFQHATNWKSYFRSVIAPYLTGDVAEVGAGLGGTTAVLNDGSPRSWLMLEPDPSLAELAQAKILSGELPANASLNIGGLEAGVAEFDAILYIDVLEHIEADRQELELAASRLRSSGHLIVLSPAFGFLFSPFDEAVGHFRRYTKSSLLTAAPSELELVSIRYYDSLGFFASVANRLFLHKDCPTQKDVLFWDRVLVRLSRLIDPLLGHRFGKSVIAVWRKG